MILSKWRALGICVLESYIVCIFKHAEHVVRLSFNPVKSESIRFPLE